ncbi:amidase family protein [Streptococcus loxodontisalivarius]|uniref:LPXTG-motif cell wall-anchored protein n=1 Tax=Streptococcus loxodontisalivarius TaxID=1349415 RepID=A0ABS2PQX3_9STRE|nr:amidase family protein [Streptococcus loxodontisalivarius]MBM7642276.1 LPXTG-motif cell wall-anchored protein [Streptococcus loxodontisalivarius]
MTNKHRQAPSYARQILLTSLIIGAGLSVLTPNIKADEETTVTSETSITISQEASTTTSTQTTSPTLASSEANPTTETETSNQAVISNPASSETSPSVEAREATDSSTEQQTTATLTEDQSSQQELITLDDYKQASATQLAEWVRDNRVSGQELIDFALQAIQETNPDLNDVISLREELARQESDALVDEGQPFFKVPILLKGLGHTISGSSNTNGLVFLKDQTTKGTSAYVKQLQKAGFIVIGQTAFPEMGWINVTNSDLYGVTHNPWNLAANPGGSSGGSAAAVASGQVAIASASDGGGSTRIPASWTGLVGLHPSRGILEGNAASSTSNVSSFAITKNIQDTSTLFETLLKESSKELQTQELLTTDIPIAYTTKTPAGTPISPDAVKAVEEAVAFLQQAGFTTIQVDYPIDGQAMMQDYYTIIAASATSVNLMAQQKLKHSLTKDDSELLTWALYQTGKTLSKADTQRAWEHVAQLTEQLNQFYETYPIFLTPTTAYPAPSADYNHIPENLKPLMEDMSQLTKEERLDLIYQQWLPAWTLTPFTQLANLTGTPSLTLPTYVTDEGLPLGILVNSKANNDRLLLQLGKIFEEGGLFKTYYQEKETTETVTLTYQTQYVDNSDLPLGQIHIIPGQNGLEEKTYRVYYQAGKEYKRVLLRSTIILDTINQVIEIGKQNQDIAEEPTITVSYQAESFSHHNQEKLPNNITLSTSPLGTKVKQDSSQTQESKLPQTGSTETWNISLLGFLSLTLTILGFKQGSKNNTLL